MIASSRHTLCETLLHLGSLYPEMRLGQLIAHVCSVADHTAPGHVEDIDDSAVLTTALETAKQRKGSLDEPANGLAASSVRARLLGVLERLADTHHDHYFGQLVSRIAETARVNVYDIEDETLLRVAEECLQNGCILERVSYAMCFPEVIKPEVIKPGQLKYVDKMKPADYLVVTVLDGRELIQWYFDVMTGGRKYEQEVRSPWNLEKPNQLTEENFVNARQIGSQGWGYTDVEPLVDVVFPELERIPLDADLLRTNRYDEAAIGLMDRLLQRKLQVANISKFFYQKRPHLIPILDEWVRCAANIPCLWDDANSRSKGLQALERRKARFGEDFRALDNIAFWLSLEPDLGAFELGFRQFRYLAGFSNNSRALHNIASWIETDPADTYLIPPLSQVRILDILAWGTIWHLKNEAQGSQLIRIES